MCKLLIFLFVCFTLITPILAQDDATSDDRPQTEAAPFSTAQTEQTMAFPTPDVEMPEQTMLEQSFSVMNTMFGAIQVFGIVVAIMTVFAGLFTLLDRSVEKARRELQDATVRTQQQLQNALTQFSEYRDKADAVMRSNQEVFQQLQEELQKSATQQREYTIRANLALSLLPLAESQHSVMDFTGALDTYLRALELNPDNIVIHYRLGYVYTQMGKLDEATSHLEHALQLDPNFAPALANLGYVLRRRAEQLPKDELTRGKLLVEAEMRLLQALSISPRLVDSDGESWWGVLGGLYRRRGLVDDAIEAYQRALQVTPKASYPFGNLALLYMQKNDADRMIEMYRKVEHIAAQQVRNEGGDYWAWMDWLVAQLALGRFNEAEATFEGLVAAIPMSTPALLDILLATLKQLAAIMGKEHAEKIQRFIDRIRALTTQDKLDD